MSNSDNNSVDFSLFDRQIRTYGEDAVKKITNSSVIIIGLEDGLATEIAKNLALGGVKNIYLYDENTIKADNLETGFYYTSNDLGKKRSNVLAPKIQELNPYISVTPIEDISKYDDSIAIIVNDLNNSMKNNFKRTVNIFSKGCAGMIFVNAGDNHIVNDITGENIESVQIGSIDNTGKVICATNHSHNFQTNDVITFSNLEGKNIDYFKEEFTIDVISPTVFKLKNFNHNNFEFINGTSIHVKKPVTINHKSFTDMIKEPTFNFSFDDSQLVFDTLMKYFQNQTDLNTDNIWSDEYKSKLTKYFSEKTIDLARTFNCQLMPVISLMGSVAASETIKLITNKYMPINQFWCWTDPVLVPKNKPDNIGSSSISKLYGSDFKHKLKSSKWFMVGSGAIGCELLKNLAYMNVATNSDGYIVLTDPDNIEKSNLNRQFLFRSHHIGQPKSKMAAQSIKEMKSDINIIAMTNKVSKEDQEFTDTIMKNITGVFNALDNIQARRYMDEQCFHKQLPLFESGTTATKGNTQAVIPFLTETYSASADPPQEKSFPICTIKNFPNEIQHTIHWAMDYFELFNRAPTNINKWLKNEKIFDQMSVENNQAKEDIMNFLINNPIKTFDDAIYKSVEMFHTNYKNQIVQLLTTYPPNHKNDDGKPFWSSGKRQPIPLDFDHNNQNHLDYIEATSHLLSRCFNIGDNYSRTYILNKVKSYTYYDNFTPDPKLQIASKDSEIKETNKNDIKLPSNKDYQHLNMSSQDFEKDDPTNWHVSWVTAASNLRAINYGIPPVSYQETKGIAGRIIPAIATTTSVVSGLIVLEMLKYMLAQEKMIEHKIENYRSTFVNLADTTLVYGEPIKAGEIEIAGIKFNNWTKFEMTHDLTVQEFKEYYEKLFKTEISMIVYDNSIIYAEFMENEDMDKNMSYVIKQKNENIDLVNNYAIVTIASSNDDINLPEIQFKTLPKQNTLASEI